MGRRRARAALVGWLCALAVTAVALAPAGGRYASAAPAPAAGTLAVSPTTYYPGQLLTWTGTLGVAGRHQVRLQKHLNRPGDTWEEVPGLSAWTAEDGSFSFRFPAPAMRGISYRVVGDASAHGAVTDDVVFWAEHQEVTVRARAADRSLPAGTVASGARFRLVVDTAAASSLVLPGRPVTLQRRVGDGWETLRAGAADAEGRAVFRLRAGDPGAVVYRVRLEDWTANGDQVGWFPSFPTYVDVLPVAHRERPAPLARPGDPAPAAVGGATVPASASPTASSTYGWRTKLYDFAWAYGESLTSQPYGGTRRGRGWWEDRSDGSGRAYVRNGGLELATSPGTRGGPGDRGSVWATLRDQPARTGRWEIRHRSDTHERGQGRYRVLIELVPDDPADHACGGRDLTIAELDPLGSVARIGVNAGSRSWSRAVPDVPQGMARSRNYAVEVTERRITWFVDGAVVGTLREPAAVPTVPMTVRLSLVGEGAPASGQPEMNATRLLFDWVRAWDPSGGTRPPRGPALEEGTYDGAC